MKIPWRLFVVILLFTACDSTTEDEVADTGSAVADSAAVKMTDNHYYWSADFDPDKGMIMVRDYPISTDSLNAGDMISKLNNLYPEIRLEMLRTSNDSIFLNIANSTFLTQQMGSSGAEAYLAEVTFNLTEVNGISYVDIRFKEGDHAAPKTFSRTDFINEPVN